MNSFNSAYYQPFGSGLAHYKDNQTGGVSYFWTQAEMIEMFEDAYDRTGGNSTWQANIASLLNGFSSDNGTSWSGNPYNDDVCWACIAYLRGYQITGNTTFRTIAKNNFDMMLARGWDNALGGIWWDTAHGGKNSVNNCPATIVAYMLYQALGDSSYLTKAQNIFNWEKAHLYDPNTGSTWANINPAGVISYNPEPLCQGSFIGACDLLGDTVNGTKAMDYAKNNMSGAGGAILFQFWDENAGIRWMAKYMKNRGLQSSYLAWLQFNANCIWANRRTSDNLCWQNWGAPTSKTDNLASWQTHSAVIALQVVPADGVVLTVNRFTSIGNSGMCLQGTADPYLNSGGSYVGLCNEVAVTPSSWNIAEQEWTLLPCGSGTCYIRNNSTGQLLQSSGDPYHLHGGGNIAGCNKLVETPAANRNSGNIWSLPTSGTGRNIVNTSSAQQLRATSDGYWSNTTQSYVSGCNQSALVPQSGGVIPQDQWNLVYVRNQ